jgi:hypothetical protein
MIRWLRMRRENREFFRNFGFNDGLDGQPVGWVPKKYKQTYELAYGRGRMARMGTKHDNTNL